MGVDLNAIAGSGYKGRIHAEDVAEFSYEKAGGITPLAKKIADAFGVDTSTIKGTGFRGKITRSDVAAVLGDRYYPNLEGIIDPFTQDKPAAPAAAAAAAAAAASSSACRSCRRFSCSIGSYSRCFSSSSCTCCLCNRRRSR